MDGDRTIDGGVVVSLQSGRLDVQLSLCHDPAAVDVSHLGGQLQVVGDRGRAFRRIGRDQWSRDLAVPVDREDTRMKRTRLPRMSPKQWRATRVIAMKHYFDIVEARAAREYWSIRALPRGDRKIVTLRLRNGDEENEETKNATRPGLHRRGWEAP